MTTTINQNSIQSADYLDAAGTGAAPFSQGVAVAATKSVKADVLTDAAGTGAPNASNGMKFSGGADTLSVYDEESVAATFSNGVNSTAVTLKFRRVGNLVTVFCPAVTVNQNSSGASISAGTVTPAAFRPAAASAFAIEIVNNTSYAVGTFNVSAAGLTEIRNTGNAAWSAGGGNPIGTTQAFCGSYVIG